jgi:drug/metabolite transporter (DMT)-like permease
MRYEPFFGNKIMDKHRNQPMIGIQAALASALFSGLAPIFGKQAILAGFSPFTVVAYRTGIAALLFVVIILIFSRKYFVIYPVGLAGCTLAGIVNGLGSLLYYSALSRLDANLGHLLYSLYPLFVALWLLLDRQSLTRITSLRLFISIPAIYLLVYTQKLSVDLIGVLLMIGAACLYGLHIIINQRVLYEVPAPTVTLYTLIAMCIVVIPAYFLFDSVPYIISPGNFSSIISLTWPVIGLALVTFLSRLTLFLGIKHLGGLQAALIGLAELFVTIVLAQWWLGERLSGLQWLGAILLCGTFILIGVDKQIPEKRKSTGWLAWINPTGLH